MCLQELDLEDNLIGDLGGRDLLDALKEREEGMKIMVVKKTVNFFFSTINLKRNMKISQKWIVFVGH